jgi:hypothetical protein
VSDPCNTLLRRVYVYPGFRCDAVACMTHVTPFFFFFWRVYGVRCDVVA